MSEGGKGRGAEEDERKWKISPWWTNVRRLFCASVVAMGRNGTGRLVAWLVGWTFDGFELLGLLGLGLGLYAEPGSLQSVVDENLKYTHMYVLCISPHIRDLR